MTRYAIYFAPDSHDPLWRFGSSVLGYDAAAGTEVAATPPMGFDITKWRDLTEDPRRYGFHATLKAPFELEPSRSRGELLAAAREFAAAHAPVTLDGLAVRALGRFIALTPIGATTAIQQLAFAAVMAFEPFRAPMSDADRARRTKGGMLTPRQLELLERYGYPYVDEQFQFHMTLTGPLAEDIRPTALSALGQQHRDMVPAGPQRIDRIAVFEQPSRDSRFRIVGAFRLG